MHRSIFGSFKEAAICLKRWALLALIVALPTMIAGPAPAQYGFAPPDADKLPGNVYYGSARDGSGKFVTGATIVLQTAQSDFVTVTDAAGRFRIKLPVGTRPGDVRARCSRKGYGAAQIIRRLPPGGMLTPVELDCRLSM